MRLLRLNFVLLILCGVALMTPAPVFATEGRYTPNDRLRICAARLDFEVNETRSLEVVMVGEAGRPEGLPPSVSHVIVVGDHAIQAHRELVVIPLTEAQYLQRAIPKVIRPADLRFLPVHVKDLADFVIHRKSLGHVGGTLRKESSVSPGPWPPALANGSILDIKGWHYGVLGHQIFEVDQGHGILRFVRYRLAIFGIRPAPGSRAWKTTDLEPAGPDGLTVGGEPVESFTVVGDAVLKIDEYVGGDPLPIEVTLTRWLDRPARPEGERFSIKLGEFEPTTAD